MQARSGPGPESWPDPWSGQTAVLGTMHGKDVAIAPALATLGLHLVVPPDFDTDRFGTFTRGIGSLEALRDHVSAGLRAAPAVFLEVDLRAHLNPTRMAVIAEAARDLVRVLASRCPACGAPGFVAVERVPGLPCGDCGLPTRETLHEVLACEPCGNRLEKRPEGASSVADPGRCDACNP